MQTDFIETMKRSIGKEYQYSMGSVDRLAMQRYAVAVGDRNPLYFDREFARQHGYKDIIAHPNYIPAILGWEAGPWEDRLRSDGTHKLPSDEMIPEGARLMGGGQDLELVAPVYPGDQIDVVLKIKDVYTKEARSGTLVFFIREKEYRNQQNELLLVCTDTLIIR